MDNLQRATVSVSINGDDLVHSEITALLGKSPRLGVCKGEIFLASHGQHIEAKTGKWLFGGEWESPPNLDNQITNILAELTEDASAWNEVTRRFECYLSVGGYFHDWAGGITLRPHTMKMLADRNLTIDFDLYATAASN